MRRRTLRTITAALGALALIAALAAATAGAAATPRVFGGSGSPLPGWMGFVVVVEGNQVALCDGTAIAPNVLLTANHCVVDPSGTRYVSAGQIHVVLGQQDPRGALTNHTADPISVTRFVSPSKYGVYPNGVTQQDISLLELSRPAPATISVVPTSRSYLWSGGSASLVLGWGLTRDGDQGSAPSQLLGAGMTIQSDGYCRSRVPNFNSTYMLCAGTGTGPSPCEGDSGGPLLVSDGASGLYEAGVVNDGTTCQDIGAPNVFARIGGSALGSWISAYAAKFQADATARAQGTAPSSAAAATPPAPATSVPKAQSPLLVASQASRDLRIALATAMGRRFDHASGFRSNCRRQSGIQFRCTAAWYRSPNDYYARVKIFLRHDGAQNKTVWAYSGSFEGVNHRCNTGPTRQTCAVTTYR